MNVQVIPKLQQAFGEFNNGAIIENKPIGFPGEGGKLRPYSNLFYWAHAWTPDEASTIGLHPHQGFEIMSFVLKGEIEHYDTKLREWRKLKAGDMQIIRAGNGISHSEKILAESSIFQIWIDPNLRVTMGKPASYDDHPSNAFPLTEDGEKVTKHYTGNGSPLKMDTPGVEILEYRLPKGKHHLKIGGRNIFSGYLIEGELQLEGKKAVSDDFMHVTNADAIEVEVQKDAKIFVILSPAEPGYQTYAKSRGM